MQITETSADGLKREFKVVVAASDIDAKMETKLQEVGKQVKLPGFRPGKVPTQVLRQRFGQSVMGEVVEEVVGESASKAIEENNLRPAMQPKIEIDKFDEGTDLEYTMSVELLPEFEITDLKKLKLERLKVDVPDSEIDDALDRLAEQRKDSKPAEGKKAVSGDVVVIDFVGKVDGEAFQGGSAEGHHLELGSNSFIPGFEEQLTGVKAGDEVEVKVQFPEQYGAQHLAGKDAVFEVKVQEVRETEAATIDDEFAKGFGEEDLESLRKAIRGQIEQEYGGVTRNKVKRDLLDALAEAHTFDVPEGMVEAEFDMIWKQFEERRKSAPEELDEDEKGKSDDDLKAEYRDIAIRRVRLGLVLSQIGTDNKIEVQQDEVTRAIMQEAQRYPGREREVMEYFRKNEEAVNSIRAPIFEDKVVDYILELADVSERSVKPDELASELGVDEHDHDHDHDHGAEAKGKKSDSAKK